MAILNSIQEGLLSSWTGNNTTITISSVDITKAFVTISWRIDANEPQHFSVTAQLENSTTIRIQRYSTSANAINLRWQVVEFSSGVTVQRGSRVMNSATENVALSSVDTSKSFPIITLRNVGVEFTAEDGVEAYISSSTNLELAGGAAGTYVTVEWQVVEYDNASVQVVQQSVTAQNVNVSISSVDLSKTFLVGSFAPGSGVTLGSEEFPNWKLTTSTNLNFYRYSTTSDAVNCTVYVVTIPSEINVQRANVSVPNGDYYTDTTITAVDTSKTMLIGASNGFCLTSANTSSDSAAVSCFAFAFVSSTSVRVTRTQNWADALVYLEVVEFISSSTDEIFKDFQRGIQRGINVGID